MPTNENDNIDIMVLANERANTHSSGGHRLILDGAGIVLLSFLAFLYTIIVLAYISSDAFATLKKISFHVCTYKNYILLQTNTLKCAFVEALFIHTHTHAHLGSSLCYYCVFALNSTLYVDIMFMYSQKSVSLFSLSHTSLARAYI